jgi:hypothetical protein
MASTYLTRTPASSTTADAWTYSVWVKRASLGIASQICCGRTDGNNQATFQFDASDQLYFDNYTAGGITVKNVTNRVFRDVGAWYHIVLDFDSSTAGARSAADRMKIWVNGVRETSFSTETQAGADATTHFCQESSCQIRIGASAAASPVAGFEGVMAHNFYVAGVGHPATVFGEFDSTSGIWVAKTSPSVTYGTNGFFLKYQDTSAFGDDSSGNTNDFVLSGTMTQTKDTPDNNFCTMNPLDNFYAGDTFSNGNTTATTSTAYGYSRCTQSLSTGKWYWEIKATTIAATDYTIGIASKPSLSATDWVGSTSESYSYVATDGKIYTSAAGTAYGDTYSAGDIIGVYLDLDNNKLYFAKNGIVQNSGTGYSITASASTTDGVYASAIGAWSGTGGNVFDGNFGNGYFGTTAVTSAVADEGGIGQFEYDPSSGTFDGSSKDFRAICTNNIATYG